MSLVSGICILLCFSLFCDTGFTQDSTLLVPAIITFGDSVVDVGNNDYLITIFKANYPPYGRDFANETSTGRFCNGKLATDIIADTLGFTSYPPAYLSPQASGNNLLQGVNFASAGSGYYDLTAFSSNVITLTQQLEYYKDYQKKLAKVAGNSKAASIIKEALYLVSFGSNDFILNYYLNPLLNILHTPDEFSSLLVGIFTKFIKDLHAQGARRIGVTSVPPFGCLPISMTLFGFGYPGCVDRLNNDAQMFNKKINLAATQLLKELTDLKLVIFDIYKPLLDLVKNPTKYGFTEAKKGCCGSGRIETTVFLCNPLSLGTCSNARQYVFWDAVHPSQAANQVLADSLILEGIELIG
ncbi:hypothetical protein ACHQM5_028813 [Ranunculus cassubicifolius]